jgi:PAS domain S-box-containing protein
MAVKATGARLHRMIVACATAGTLAIGVVVAVVGVWPLYARLRESEQENLLGAHRARVFAAEEFLLRVKDMAEQIASRSRVREHLEAHSRGETTREEFQQVIVPMLQDSLVRAEEIVGMAQLDQRGSLAVQVGTAIPPDCLRPAELAATGAVVEGPVIRDGEPFLVVRASIRDRQSVRVGTDLLLFRLTRLRRIVCDRTGLGGTGEVLLGLPHHDHVDLFFPGRGETGSVVPATSSLGKALVKGRDGEAGLMESDPAEGPRFILVYGPVPGTGWGLAVRMARSELYAVVNRQIALLGGVLALLIGLGALGLASLLRPLTARAVAHTGQLERQVREQTAALEAELAERRRAQDALASRGELLHALIGNLPDYIYVKDAEGRFLLTNDAHALFLGLRSPEEAIGKTDFEFSPRDLAERYQADERQIIESGRPFVDRVEPVVDAAGRRRWVSTSKVPLRDGQGRVVGLVGMSRDITEAQRATEALRENERRLRSLVETAPSSIVGLSLDHRIEEFNPEAERIYGRRRDEVIGQDYLKLLVPAPERPGVAAVIQRVLAGEAVRGLENALLAPDGAERVLTWNLDRLLDPQGRPVGIIAVGQDITARKRAEEILAQRTEELTRSNAELEQFATVASHDLQEPLRMVRSYVQLLAQRHRGRLDADADDFIHYAVEGAERMQQLINDLLTYSRVNMRGKELRPTSAEAALAQAVRSLETSITAAGAEVTHDPLPTVQADEGQIVQLFQCLLSNALKFRSEEPPRVHVAAEERDGRWVFSVRDNGIGIAPEYSERIFRLFQRLHSREQYPGTGMGLAVCKRIVERHGGRIWVESQPGKGSTFRFSLPKSEGVTP